MRETKNFTVVLRHDDAAKISSMVEKFGGSVGGFCTSVVRDYVNLSPDQIATVREQIRALARESRNAKTTEGPTE